MGYNWTPLELLEHLGRKVDFLADVGPYRPVPEWVYAIIVEMMLPATVSYGDIYVIVVYDGVERERIEGLDQIRNRLRKRVHTSGARTRSGSSNP